MSQADEFFGEKNQAMLQRLLYKDICRRIGGDLNEKQANRLIKTVKHYMGEIYRVQGDSKPIRVLNQEVLQVTLPDYIQYIERSQRGSGRSVLSDIEAGAEPEPSVPQRPVGLIDNGRPMYSMTDDVSTAFSKLQNARQDAQKKPPAPRDFRISLQDDPPVNLNMFERMKKEREEEALAQAQQTQHLMAASSLAEVTQNRSIVSANQGQGRFADATGNYAVDKRRAQEEADQAFAEEERRRLEARAQANSGALLPLRPDMRDVLFGDNKQALTRTMYIPPGPANESAGNPTLAQPTRLREPTGGLQQSIIVREPDTMPYKENELNLFIYSADRDWVTNSQETRYNFTVNFDPSNLPTGLRMGPTSIAKFRNIVRIEFVKAIMPGENIENLVIKTGATAYSAPYNVNVLSFPYIQVRIPELDNNVYGTNNAVNSAFAVIQYDANWVYDTASDLNNRGYLAMIPKFLKCQKVYQPTPLATLNKLTFQFQRPDGSFISSVPDTFDISGVYSSKMFNSGNYQYDGTTEANTGAAYYFIVTKKYFSCKSMSVGDHIQIKNLTYSAAATGALGSAVTEVTNFLQDDNGLLIVATGVASGGSPPTSYTTLANSQGYCNLIIVRGKWNDPSTGSITTARLGGVADTSAGGVPTAGSLTQYLSANTAATGRLINLTNQVQVTMRVITREIDPVSVLRPDNNTY